VQGWRKFRGELTARSEHERSEQRIRYPFLRSATLKEAPHFKSAAMFAGRRSNFMGSSCCRFTKSAW